jgi:hypothetical protein
MLFKLGLTLLAVPVFLLGFEHFRHIATKRTRLNALNTHYTFNSFLQYDITHYLLLPLTVLMGWVSHSTSNNSNIFTSLMVGRRFVNPFREWDDRCIADFFAYIKYQITRTNRNNVPDKETLDKTLPVLFPNFSLIGEKTINPFIACTWFGQSTCLLQMDGFTILTDPIFTYII